jgi:hypothetical protein
MNVELRTKSLELGPLHGSTDHEVYRGSSFYVLSFTFPKDLYANFD